MINTNSDYLFQNFWSIIKKLPIRYLC